MTGFDFVAKAYLLMIVGGLAITLYQNKKSSATLMINVFFIAMFVQSAFPIYNFQAQDDVDGGEVDLSQVRRANDFTGIALSKRPSILHIVLDGYSNSRIYKQFYGYDITPFENELKSLGFSIFSNARPPYSQTLLIMSAITTGSLSLAEAQPYAGMSVRQFRQVLGRLITSGPLVKSLTRNGYDIGFVESGYAFFEADSKNIKTDGKKGFSLNQLESNLLGKWFNGAQVAAENHIKLLRAAFDVQPLLEMQPPFYYYQHVLAPHPPFTIDARGKYRASELNSIGDGSHAIRDDDARRKEYIAGYVEKTKFAQSAVLAEVRALLENTDTPLVIFIHGDHGGGAYYDQEDVTKTTLEERFSPFLAVYSNVPAVKDQFQKRADGEFNLVNLYRVLFTALGIEGLEPIEGRVAYTPWSAPRQPIFIDQDRLASHNP